NDRERFPSDHRRSRLDPAARAISCLSARSVRRARVRSSRIPGSPSPPRGARGLHQRQGDRGRAMNEELAVVETPATITLFGTNEPAAIVERMGDVAGVLMQAVRERGLARRYGDGDREFLHIEAWQFLGSMLGVSARVVWTKALEG